MNLQILPFSQPCEWCDAATEIMTSTHGDYMVISEETAQPGDRVYCTWCDCSAIMQHDLDGCLQPEWGEPCESCKAVLDQKLASLAKIVQERLGCQSVTIRREIQ